jgi:hypothetical protein
MKQESEQPHRINDFDSDSTRIDISPVKILLRLLCLVFRLEPYKAKPSRMAILSMDELDIGNCAFYSKMFSETSIG